MVAKQPYHITPDVTFYVGDALEVLKGLPSESVHCCVTSPPYYGLRNYGVDGQIGLEETPEQYVVKMVELCREVKRVLRADGTAWVNMGDAYGTGTTARRQDGQRGIGANTQAAQDAVPRIGLQAKQLIGMPWRLAFALQVDGWYLRSDIIWHKPNPMPESVMDRPTKSHEYIFLFSRQERYYYDAEAIREPATHAGKIVTLGEKSLSKGQATGANVKASGNALADSVIVANGRNKRSVWTIATAPFSESHFATFPPDLIKPCILAGTSERGCCPECGKPWERVLERSKQLHGSRPQARRAMEIAKANSLTDQHIAAIQSAGITDAGKAMITQTGTGKNTAEVQALAQEAKDVLGGYYREYLSAPQETVGWQPSCKHDHEPIPCTVLDCFGGAGTTALVSRQLNRKSIYIDLNTEYADMAIRRLEGQALPLPLEVV